MSDTSPKNQDALLPGHVPKTSTRAARRGEAIWRLTKDHAMLICEILDDARAGAGYEVRLRTNDELIIGRRCDTRGLADDVADAFRRDHLRTGWQDVRI